MYLAERYFISYRNNFTQQLKCDRIFNSILTNGIDCHGLV